MTLWFGRKVGRRLIRSALLSGLTRLFGRVVDWYLGTMVTQSVVDSLFRQYCRLVAGSFGHPVGWWLKRSVEQPISGSFVRPYGRMVVPWFGSKIGWRFRLVVVVSSVVRSCSRLLPWLYVHVVGWWLS